MENTKCKQTSQREKTHSDFSQQKHKCPVFFTSHENQGIKVKGLIGVWLWRKQTNKQTTQRSTEKDSTYILCPAKFAQAKTCKSIHDVPCSIYAMMSSRDVWYIFIKTQTALNNSMRLSKRQGNRWFWAQNISRPWMFIILFLIQANR